MAYSSYRRPRKPARPKPPQRFQSGPWRGMRDSADPLVSQPDLAFLLQNVYPLDPGAPSAVVGRPGFEATGGTSSTVPYLGSSSATSHIAQGIAQWTKENGTRYTMGWADGKMYTYDWATELWTEVSLGAFVFSTTAHVYWAVLADRIIFHDGVIKPLTWDGTTVAQLADCPILYGRIVVYYAKLFGIKASERNTIVWSEEDDPTTGYETGFTNAWTLSQTNQEPLHALAATNQALYFFRAGSIGYVLGAVTDDFQAAGTVDSGGDAVGTTSPASILLVTDDDTGAQSIFFVDISGRPRRLVGSSLQGSIWRDAAETVRRINLAYVSRMESALQPELNLVLVSAPLDGASAPNAVLCFDAGSGQFSGIWDGFRPRVMGVVTDSSERKRLMYIEEAVGRPAVQGTPDGDVWTDVGLSGGANAIIHTVEPMPMGWDVAVAKHFGRVDLTLRLESDISGVALDYISPTYQRSTAQTLPSVDADFGDWEDSDPDLASEPFPCLLFDSDASPDQSATLPLPGAGTFGGVCTFEALIRVPNLSGIAGSIWPFEGASALGTGSHGVAIGSTGNIRGWFERQALAVVVQASSAIVINAWRRVVLVADSNSTNSCRIFVIASDGTVIENTDVSGNNPYNTLVSLVLGKRLTPVNGHTFDAGTDYDGYIADVRVWDVARSIADCAADAFSRLVGNEPGLVRYWKLDEGAGTSLTDAVAGATGTIANATWASVLGTPVTEQAPQVLMGRQVLERHLAAGIGVPGRWIRPRVKHQTSGEQFGLTSISVTATPEGDDPGFS
jgi:hypothetical protein